MFTKYLVLFLGLSLCIFHEVKALEYQCYNPTTKKTVGKPFSAFGQINIAERCTKEAPIECPTTAPCTNAPKVKSGFF